MNNNIYRRKPESFKYILFNKPYNVLCQFTKVDGKKTLADFGFPKNVYAVGRLDYDSEGLLLLTDDATVKYRIEDPKFRQHKTYLAQVENTPTEFDIEKLRRGVRIKNNSTNTYFTTLPAHIELLGEAPKIFPRSVPIRFRKNVPTQWLKIMLREGKNRRSEEHTSEL